jgi:phage tail-like protein
LIVSGFSEASTLEAEAAVEIIEEGGVNDNVHKLPKKTKCPNIVLKRGIADSDMLWEWYQDVVNGKMSRNSGFIILLDSMGNEKWRWRFAEAYPVKWIGPQLKTNCNLVEIESLELVHEGISKA